MDEGLVGQVGHARGHLTTVTQEGVAANRYVPVCLHVKEVAPEVSFTQQFQHQQHLLDNTM